MAVNTKSFDRHGDEETERMDEHPATHINLGPTLGAVSPRPELLHHVDHRNDREESGLTVLPPPPPLSPLIRRREEHKSLETGPRTCGMIQKELRLCLVQAIERDDLSAVQHSIQEGLQLNCIIVFNKTPLTYALERSAFDIAKALVKAGVNVNAREPIATVRQPLHIAVDIQSGDMVRFLLEHGAEVDGRNGCGATPLMLACALGHVGIVKLLHDHGADLNAKDGVRRTALHRAAEGQHASIIIFLLTRGADVNAVDKFGWTAMYHSIVFCHVAVIKLLLSFGMTVTNVDTCQVSPLLAAVNRFSTHNIQVIVSTSLDFYKRQRKIPSTELHDALNAAMSHGDHLVEFQVIQLLVNAGSEIDLSQLASFLNQCPIRAFDSKHMQAVWHYLVLSSGACCAQLTHMQELAVFIADIQQWMEDKRSLRHFCRSTIRKHLVTAARCRDVRGSVQQLPVPQSVKDFIDLSDFVDTYPEYTSAFTAAHASLHKDLKLQEGT